MEHSFTNRAKHWRGDTVAMTVRLPRPLADFIDSQVDGTGQIRNRSEYLQHWAAVGQLIDENVELTEAIDWALDQPQSIPAEVRVAEPELDAISSEAQAATDFAILTINTPEAVPDLAWPSNELNQIRETQLEAMRNRVR